MTTKKNPPPSASQGRGWRYPPSTPRWISSSFILHTSSFRFLRTALCLLITAYCLLPTVLTAQGCALCYNSASAAKAGAKEALANGVLILLVPPMVFFALITVVVYMYRDKFREMSVVSGPLSVARRSNDPEFRRSDDPSAGAPDFGFWSPDPLPRTTDHGQRTRRLRGQGNDHD